MLISMSSIQNFFAEDLNIEEVSEKLTMAGLEVDSIVKCDFSPIDQNIVIGIIEDIKKHPNADKLQICTVNTKNETLSIICGASNIKINDIVPVAKIGAQLPNGLKIKKSKIRDEYSYGMLCSLKELGQPYEIEDGILLLPDEFEIGQPLNQSTSLNDYILDMGITPNRGDCLSSFGIAREISATLNKSIKPMFDFENNDLFKSNSINELTVNIESKNVRRYCIAKIENVKVADSPFWLKNFLAKFGVSTVNNLVDITNYFMIVSGQPIHAFDYDLVEGSSLTITENNSSQIETLSNVSCNTDNILTISDNKGPIAIAGIIGGKRTSVSKKTKNILIECASFEPSCVRSNSKKINISTESSFRFERDISEHLTKSNLNFATKLIKNFCGGDICEDSFDSKPDLKYLKKINVNYSYICKKIGIRMSKDEIIKVLESININVIDTNDTDGTFSIPAYRPDINYDYDLIEEVARMKGLNSIPNTPPLIPVTKKLESNFINTRNLRRTIRSVMASEGFSEVINFSFLDSNKFKDENSKEFKIINPLSSDTSVLRNTILQSLLANSFYNLNRGSDDINLFEIGKVYDYKFDNNEKLELAIISSNVRENLFWDKTEFNFYDLKGSLEKIFMSLSIDLKLIKYNEISESLSSIFHPGKSAEVWLDNNLVGSIGEINPRLLKELDIKKPMIASIVNLDLLFKFIPNIKKMRSFSSLPQVKRDFSLIIDSSIKSGDIVDEIFNLNINNLSDVKIFDSFKSEKIGANKVSLSLTLVFESQDKTLEDKEVTDITEIIINTLRNKFDIEVRK